MQHSGFGDNDDDGSSFLRAMIVRPMWASMVTLRMDILPLKVMFELHLLLLLMVMGGDDDDDDGHPDHDNDSPRTRVNTTRA